MVKLEDSRFITKDHPKWWEWLDICKYTRWDPEGPLQPVMYRGFIKPYSSALKVGPYFYNDLLKLVKQKKAIRMAFVGGAGLGKTYASLHIAQILDPKFTVDQIVFSGEDYLRLQNTLKDGQVMMMEEPTYMASARGWQSDWQQAVVRTIESSRFQNNPLLIPVVNRNLLDKIVREHYVNLVMEMFDRGFGRVYDYKQSQWQPNGMRSTKTDLAIFEPGVDLARCGRSTCLSCKEMPTCNKYIWPQYERKREEWIDFYQTRDRETLEAKNNKDTSQDRFREIILEASKIIDKLKTVKGKLDTGLILYHVEGVTNREDARLIKNVLESGTMLVGVEPL